MILIINKASYLYHVYVFVVLCNENVNIAVFYVQ